MERGGYRSLVVWQRSRELAISVFRQSAHGPLSREWGLRDQLRRSAVSVPSNIAEGAARGTNQDCVRFLWIAKGSLAELATQVDIAENVDLLDPEISKRWQLECRGISGMLRRLIDTRRLAGR